jgi:hypothetical protein
MLANQSKIVKNSIISLFVALYTIVATVSTIHLIDFFLLSNPYWLAVTLAVAFEIGAAASLASIIILDQTNRNLVWFLFIVITLMQIQGNMFFTFTHLGPEEFKQWSQLFGLKDKSIIYQKRILSIVSGGILPVVALGFIKSLVDYIRPAHQTQNANDASVNTNNTNTSDTEKDNELYNSTNEDNHLANTSIKEEVSVDNLMNDSAPEQESSQENNEEANQDDATSIMGLEEEEEEDQMQKAMRKKAENQKKGLANS